MKRITLFFFVAQLFTFFSCQNDSQQNLNVTAESLGLVPVPASLEIQKGRFKLSKSTTIQASGKAASIASYLNGHLQKFYGFALEITDKAGGKNAIVLQEIAKNNEGGKEAYSLQVNSKGISILGEPAGLFYGIQTLIQLLPLEKSESLTIPAVQIDDRPRFGYRGMHLDVGRHFMPVAFVKKYIDQIARHKMNTFHWHLTEDQGWRIEIKKYPKLTEIGAWRKETVIGHNRDKPQKFDGKRSGGFYTQEEIKDIVAYAADRFITVIPEIEMPGHSLAALAAYPELGCTEGPFEVATKWGIFNDVYCPNEETFRFLEDVLTEVIALFPSPYIHIGGDECPKTRWEESAFCQQLIKKEGLKDEHELQSYFIQRIEKFLNSKGKQIIGWDEILEGGLAPNATVMSWRGIKGGIAAAKQHHNVIMTPTDYCYFDYYQSESKDTEPLAIGGFLPVEKVYSYEPIPEELTAAEAKYILGAQANVWTEYIPTPAQAEYMIFPRMCALAEVVWSPKEKRNWNSFTTRMQTHFKRLDAFHINYAKHLLAATE